MRTYQFKQQVRNRGLYAKITFDVAINTSINKSVLNYKADSRWLAAVQAGVLIFENYFGRTANGELEITIYDIHWMPVDSDDLIVMFTTVNALCDALNFQIDQLKFDPDNEVFIFPDRRAF